MGGEEKKEIDWLQQLCGEDVKLYDVLARNLYVDPIAAISKEDLGILIKEAEKSVKDKNFEEAMTKYRLALEKAIFEATQHQEERSRHKLIQDLASKGAQATETVKQKVEKEGAADRVAHLERRIEYCKFVSERIEDVMKVASPYYNERVEILGEKERGEARTEEQRDKRETSKDESWREKKRDKKREKQRKEERLEEEREEKREEKAEKERGEARREKILEDRR